MFKINFERQDYERDKIFSGNFGARHLNFLR